MPVPTPDKTWDASRNNSISAQGSALATHRRVMRTIKNALITSSFTKEMTVWGSNNGAGTFGNNDGVDRWSADSNLVWAIAGSNHSWIVLTQNGINTNTALCIDLNNASDGTASFIVSPSAGFGSANGGADGTATARPTATDEIAVSALSWAGGQSDVAYVVHTFISTDGQCNRVVLYYNSLPVFCLLLDKPKGPVSGWTNPAIFMAVGSGSSAINMATLNRSSNFNSKAGATTITMSATASGSATGAASMDANLNQDAVAEELSGEWPLYPVGLYCYTSGARGPKGEVFDLWWGAVTLPDGTTYPQDASRKFVQFGDLVMVWDIAGTGIIPLLA